MKDTNPALRDRSRTLIVSANPLGIERPLVFSGGGQTAGFFVSDNLE